MRTLLVVVGLLGGCSDASDPARIGWSCNYPDAVPAGTACECFDGDVRCREACPLDLSTACTPGDSCGDLSGGSAGQDCVCTCGTDAKWTCTGYDGTCVPM